MPVVMQTNNDIRKIIEREVPHDIDLKALFRRITPVVFVEDLDVQVKDLKLSRPINMYDK